MKLRNILLLFLLILIPTCLANSLPYWIEELPNGSFNIWTKINISAGGTITLIVKKEPGYSPNGDAVFEFFDDFDGTSLNTSKWTAIPNGWSISVANSTLIFNGSGTGTDSLVRIYSNKVFTRPFVVELKQRVISGHWSGIHALHTSSDAAYVIYTADISSVGSGDVFTGYYHAGSHTSYSGWVNTGYFKYNEDVWLTMVISPTGISYIAKSKLGIWKYSVNNTVLQSGSIGIVKSERGTGKSIFYWIFVRKYADQDPIVTVEQVSNTTLTVKITNPNSYNLTDFQVAIPVTGFVSTINESLMIESTPFAQVEYYKSIGGYTLTIYGNLGNVSVYLGSTLIFTGNITENNPYQKIFPYDVSSYSLKIVYHDYENASVSYKLNPISEGTYTLALTPVGNYTNESFYPLVITVAGKSYWISNYSCIPLNVSITAYQNTPISITTSLGEEISVPAENQKVPIFFTTTYSQIEAKTLQGHIIEFKSKYGIVGYGQDINIKVPTGLVITPYLDNFPLQPITVSQNLNLFYNPSLIKREIYAYQTIDGKIVVSIKSLLPANFTVLIKGENDTIYLNQSVIPGIYKFNYPDTNQSVILEVLVNNKVALSKTLVPPGEINSWNNLGDLTKIAILFILAAILAIVYLSSGLSAALGLTLAGSLILLLPIPDRLKPILAATVFLSIMLYLYLRRW